MAPTSQLLKGKPPLLQLLDINFSQLQKLPLHYQVWHLSAISQHSYAQKSCFTQSLTWRRGAHIEWRGALWTQHFRDKSYFDPLYILDNFALPFHLKVNDKLAIPLDVTSQIVFFVSVAFNYRKWFLIKSWINCVFMCLSLITLKWKSITLTSENWF